MWSDPAFNEKSDCGTSAGPRPLPLNLCVRSQHQKNRIFMYGVALVADIYSPNFDLLLWKSITTKEFDRSESRWVAELS